MNRDRDEQNRPLTPAEQRRMKHFQEISAQMEEQGFQKTELTISLVRASIVILIAAVPVVAAAFFLFGNVHPNALRHASTTISFGKLASIVIGLILLTVVHELIHGLFWGLFSKHHFRDIEFGVIWKYGAAYCTCKEPLTRRQYILGGIMPLILLGIMPLVYGIAAGAVPGLLIGLVMTLAAGGDVMIILSLLRFRTDAEEVVIYDHPTQGGSVVFTRG